MFGDLRYWVYWGSAVAALMSSGCDALSGSPDGLKVGTTKVAVGSRAAWTISDTCTGNFRDGGDFCSQDEVTDIQVTFSPEGILVSHGLRAHEPGTKYKHLVVEALRSGEVEAHFSGRISGQLYDLTKRVEAVVPNEVFTDFCFERELLVSTSRGVALNPILKHDGDTVPWVGVDEIGRLVPFYWEPSEALRGTSIYSVAPTDYRGPASLKSEFDASWSLDFQVIDPHEVDGVIFSYVNDSQVFFQEDQLPRNLDLRPVYTSQGKAVCGAAAMRVLVRSLTPETCYPKGQGDANEVEFKGSEPAMTIIGFGECRIEFEPTSEAGSNTIQVRIQIAESHT